LPMSALEELRMLSNFQFGGQALLQIFLLGQPEFREALAQPRFEQLRQRVIATHHLTAMTPDETGPYIMHRLACAGWKGAPRFSQGAFESFHRLSGGIPRRLNMLAARVLLQGAIERLVDIDQDVVDDVAADLASESIMPAEPKPGGQPVPFAFPEASPRPVAPSAPDTWFRPAFAPQMAPQPAPQPAAPFVQDIYAPLPEAFAALPENVPPPSIAQPPRYDGVVPPEAVPAPAAPPIPPSRPTLRAVENDLPEPAAEPAAEPAVPGPQLPSAADMAARNAELEARLAEQEKILRRTLSLLVEWVESDEPRPRGGSQNAA